MLAKSIPLPAPTFTPIDRRHDAVHDETRLVAAHLSVHARVQASVMRSAGAGRARTRAGRSGSSSSCPISAALTGRLASGEGMGTPGSESAKGEASGAQNQTGARRPIRERMDGPAGHPSVGAAGLRGARTRVPSPPRRGIVPAPEAAG